MSTSNSLPASSQVDMSRFWVAALASVAGAAVANVILFLIVRFFYEAPVGFTPLAIPSILIFTIIGTGLGALVFRFLAGRSATPIKTYRTIAIIALVLSIIPNILAYFNPSLFPIPGGEPAAFLVLILFHIVAAVVSFLILTSMVTRR